ncbi:MAG: lysophospholipid acyltransferase family protein [Acidimicrobiales bacterium]
MADPDVGQLYSIARAIGRPVSRFLWGIRIDGLGNVPASGPGIVCANHISFLDSPFLMWSLPRRLTFVGKAEYLDSWKTRYLFPAVGMIPIDRSGGEASTRALDAAAGILERGELFGIYPEGTRSRSGKLHKGHTGPARLALRTGAPIIPVGIRGTDRIQPPEAKLPRLFLPCELRFGTPVRVGKYGERAKHDRLVFREITDEVMFEIRELSGQEYVDTYATKKPDEGLPAEPAVVRSADGEAPTDGAAAPLSAGPA